MANTKLSNGNLKFDLEKLKSYDKPKVNKDKFNNDVHEIIFTIEVNDNSYMYLDKDERDQDFIALKQQLVQ